MQSIHSIDPVGNGEFVCAQQGCLHCQDALIRAHTGLIHTILRRVEHRGVPYAELVQAGRLALWRAVLHFDPSRGVRFSTYGGRAIERALWDAVRLARQAEAPPALFPAPEEPDLLTQASQQPGVQRALRTVVQQLPARLQAVLTALYGLDGRPPQTQAGLGRAWGLSGERIRQLRQDALVGLRQPGLSGDLYALCAQDTREAYLQALRLNRAWQRRRR